MMNGAPPPTPPTYDGNLPVSITLPLVTWNTVLNMIAEAPWKTADPLMQEIRKQLTTSLATAPTIAPQPEMRQ